MQTPSNVKTFYAKLPVPAWKLEVIRQEAVLERAQEARDINKQWEKNVIEKAKAERRAIRAAAAARKATAAAPIKRGRPLGSRNKEPGKPRKQYASRAATCTFRCMDEACDCKMMFTEEGAQHHLAHRKKHPRKNGPERFRFLPPSSGAWETFMVCQNLYLLLIYLGPVYVRDLFDASPPRTPEVAPRSATPELQFSPYDEAQVLADLIAADADERASTTPTTDTMGGGGGSLDTVGGDETPAIHKKRRGRPPGRRTGSGRITDPGLFLVRATYLFR
jgi:hypothetical protein